MRIELRSGDRLECREDNRQVLRLASRHDGVGGNFLDGRGTHVRGQRSEHLARIAPGAGEHAHDPLRGGRNHRQAIGEAALEHEFEGVLRADLNLTRREIVAARRGLEPFGDFRSTALEPHPGRCCGYFVQSMAGAAAPDTRASSAIRFCQSGLSKPTKRRISLPSGVARMMHGTVSKPYANDVFSAESSSIGVVSRNCSTSLALPSASCPIARTSILDANAL